MSDDQNQENGNSGEVPEIELIIKVSLRLFPSTIFNICIINHSLDFSKS